MPGAKQAQRRVDSHSGVTASGASHEAGNSATISSSRQGVTATRAVAGCGLATMATSSVPPCSRNIASAEPAASSFTSTPGARRPKASSTSGSRRMPTPADTPTFTTPTLPAARRRTMSTRSSLAASSLRPSSTSAWPAAVSPAWRRPRSTSGTCMRASSSLMCRLIVGGARCSACDAAAKVPRSAIAIRVWI